MCSESFKMSRHMPRNSAYEISPLPSASTTLNSLNHDGVSQGGTTDCYATFRGDDSSRISSAVALGSFSISRARSRWNNRSFSARSASPARWLRSATSCLNTSAILTLLELMRQEDEALLIFLSRSRCSLSRRSELASTSLARGVSARGLSIVNGGSGPSKRERDVQRWRVQVPLHAFLGKCRQTTDISGLMPSRVASRRA